MRNMFKRRRALIASTLINLYVLLTTSGVSPLTLLNTVTKNIKSLIQFGKYTQPSGIWNTAITQEGKVEQRNLPGGYTELTYLQSSGTQLLQLDIKRQSGKAYAMQADLEASVFGSTSSGLFTLGSDYAGYCVVSRKWNTTNMVMMSGSVESSGLVYTGRATYTVSVATDGLSCTLSDGTNTASYTRTTANYSNKPVLFGLDTSYKGTCKIYSAKLWEDDVLKFDLVPCMNADGVCGMFNRVDGSFIAPYVGSLAAGDVVTPSPEHPVDIVTNNGVLKVRRQSGMPLAYQMVEWLKPTNAILITGFKTKSTQEIECVFYRESSASSYLYQSDTASSGTTNTTAYLTTSSGNWRWDGKTYSISVSSGIKITSVQNKDGVWLNGTKYGYYTDAGEFVSENDLSLASYTNTSVRIYSMVIREGETVTLDLVPVQRVLDGVYGFYDRASGNFYTNADATFVAGDPIDDPVEIYMDGEDEVLTVRGTNLLDPSTSNITIGESVSADGSSAVVANNWRTDYIPIEGGKTYAFWGRKKEGNTISAYNRINWYTADKVHISPRPSYTINTVTIATAPSNAAFVRLSSAPYNSQATITRDIFELFNWTLAEGSAGIPYQPYVQPQTVTVPMLLGVGDYKDSAEIISGLLTNNVGIKVLDGTEEDLAFNTQYNVAYFYIQDKKVGVTDFTPLLCTHLRNNSVAFSNMGYGEIASTKRDNGINMRVSSAITSLTLFKQWLASEYANGTPVIVIYPLATETTESMTAYPQLCNKCYNTASIEAEVDDISVTFTTGAQTIPSPYSQLPIKCNNGELKWNGTAVVADGTLEVLKIIGQNLVDLTAVTNDYYYDQNGVYTATENARLSDFIPVKAGQKYTAYVVNRGSVYAFNVRVNLFSTDRVWLSQSATPVNQPSVIVITPTEDGYLRLSANYKGTAPTSSWVDWSTLQIVVGEYTLATMPSYQPYSAQTASVENLLAVGDYKDTQEIIDGLLTHKVGIKVLTGTEDWRESGNLFYAGIATDALEDTHSCYCTHFKGVATNASANYDNEVKVGTNVSQTVNWTRVQIYPVVGTYSNVTAFKQWLAAQYAAGTPVIVIYPLATETTESVTPQPLHTTVGTNVVSVEAEVDGIELTVEYFGKSI